MVSMNIRIMIVAALLLRPVHLYHLKRLLPQILAPCPAGHLPGLFLMQASMIYPVFDACVIRLIALTCFTYLLRAKPVASLIIGCNHFPCPRTTWPVVSYALSGTHVFCVLAVR